MKKSKVLSRILLGITFLSFIFAGYHIAIRYIPVNTTVVAHKPITEIGSPVLISIESQNIKLPIFGAVINGNEWETTKEGVSYLTETPLPGNKGNSVIYGHNFPNLFGKLIKVKKGDLVQVDFNDGKSKKFEIQETFEVTPDQTHILKQTDDFRLTLYTCSGFLDSKRFVAVAKLVN